ncbi:MAG: MarR family transcriptional regulator, partial [Kiloniellales bacterium]
MSWPNRLGTLATLIADRLAQSYGDLSPAASAALLTVAQRGPITTAELAAILGVAQPTATRVVDTLAAQALLERRRKRGRVTPLAVT